MAHTAPYVNRLSINTVMILQELTEGMAWAKRGNKVVRKFFAQAADAKAAIVSSPAQCFAATLILRNV